MDIPPSRYTKINWNDFLITIIKKSRKDQESCAWIFVDIKNDEWNIIEVKNVGLTGQSKRHTFAPDKKDFAKAKRLARKNGWTRIGCVHTHVVNNDEEAEYQMRPSEADLKYARKFNDIIRGIVVVKFDWHKNGIIYGMIWLDQYGTILMREIYE